MKHAENDPAEDTNPEGVASDQDQSVAAGPEGAEGAVGEAAGGVAPDELAESQRLLDEQRDKYLRLAAEYDNFRKRTTRERSEAAARGQAELLRHLMDALDDLARFAHVDPESADAKTIVQGVEMVERKLLKALTAAGLTVVNPENSTFDPELHEAVATEPAQAPEDDHVVSRVFQPGYVFNGQLLRPARVVVKIWNG